VRPRLAVYEGFPEGVSDGFCRHAAVATSQYGTTARALAAEVLALREELALVLVERDIHRDYRLRAEATLAAIRAWAVEVEEKKTFGTLSYLVPLKVLSLHATPEETP
jgi:hypothetical protein